jgi:hypothetical protein
MSANELIVHPLCLNAERTAALIRRLQEELLRS